MGPPADRGGGACPGLTIELTAEMWPSAMLSTTTAISLPAASETMAPGWPLTCTWRWDRPPNGSPARIPDSSTRGNLGPTMDGAGDGPYPAATVAVEHDVVGQQLLESLQVAVAERGQEAARQLLTPLR
jgi:hypothetical protein